MESNEIISIVNKDGIQYVDARTLHETLGVGRDFSNWIKDKIQKYGFIEGKDFSPKLAESSGGRPSIEYLLSLNTAKELAMVENNEQGRKIRQYLIKVEEAWNSPEMVMARALQCSTKLLETYKDKIAIMEPKAEVYDKIADSSGLKTIQEVAAILGIGPNILFATLRDKKIFKYDNGSNVPNSQYCENGLDYFRPKEEPYNRGGESFVYTRIYVTPKGELWLARFLKSLESANIK